MVIYKATYRCRLCEEIFMDAQTANKGIVETCLSAICANNEFLSRSIIGGPIFEKMCHHCPDGSYGLGDFVGFQAVKERSGTE